MGGKGCVRWSGVSGCKWDNCNRINKYKIYKENDKLTTTKLKMDLTFDPAIPFLGIYPKEPKTLIQKNISTPVFMAALFSIAKMWKQPESSSVNEWTKTIVNFLFYGQVVFHCVNVL